VLDAGCGKAEILIRVVDRYGATGIGVDHSPWFIAEARERLKEHWSADSIELLQRDIKDFDAAPASFDFAICTGATQLFDDYRGAITALKELVRPGGLLLIGEPFWKRDPDPDYLEVLNAPRDAYATHAGTVAIGVEAGLVPLYITASSEDEWDHYEGLYLRGIERHAVAHPEDPEVPQMLLRIRAWRDTYLRWGRDTLGFGWYLFRS
jgi:ubiquinone/menaquinone biosynthesis C-methylase UbiE